MTEKGFKKGFTLMELLVTIGIMAVIVTLTVPAFIGLGRGSKMNSALSNLKNTCSLARQWAISHRDDVYIVFPIEGDVDPDEPVKTLNSYGVFSANEEEFIKEWTYLPEGIVFQKDQMEALLDNPPENLSNEINVPGLNNGTLKVIAYGQEGSIVGARGSDKIMVYFLEGTYDRESNMIIETFGSDDDRIDAVRVNPLTGLPYIERDINKP